MSDSSTPAEDDRFFVVNGRRWRRQDPSLPEDVAAELKSQLGRGRSGVRVAKSSGDDQAVRACRRRVDLAKHGLGERGTAWWDQDPAERRRRWTDALDDLRALDP